MWVHVCSRIIFKWISPMTWTRSSKCRVRVTQDSSDPWDSWSVHIVDFLLLFFDFMIVILLFALEMFLLLLLLTVVINLHLLFFKFIFWIFELLLPHISLYCRPLFLLVFLSHSLSVILCIFINFLVLSICLSSSLVDFKKALGYLISDTAQVFFLWLDFCSKI